MLNASNKKTDQHLLDFWTGIGAAAYTTLEVEQLISHMKTVIVYTIASMWDDNEKVILKSEET